MTTDPFSPEPANLIGRPGDELTGVECRILRAALGLERRHVARFALAMGYGSVSPTPERVTAWERAKGRGYPPDLVQGLTTLDEAVEGWARQAVDEAQGHGAPILWRPLGYRYAFAMLDLACYGLTLSPDQLAGIDDVNGEFWVALADTAIARAALYLRPPPGQTHWAAPRIMLETLPYEETSTGQTGEAAQGHMTASADNRMTFDAAADRPRNIYRDPKA